MTFDIKKIVEKYKIREEKKERIVKRIIETRDLIDENGYPSHWAGLCIRIWPNEKPDEWMKFIGDLWAYKDWGWKEIIQPHEYKENELVCRYSLSTAGWSGNEYLIDCMKKHDRLWSDNWVQSRRGGHYIFDLKLKNNV
jgi:hypothetical protein